MAGRHVLPQGPARRPVECERPADGLLGPLRHRPPQTWLELRREEPGRADAETETAGARAVRRTGENLERGAHADARTHDHAPGGGRPVEGPPAGDGPLEGGHRAARLRAARPARRVQTRVLRYVRNDDGPRRGRDAALPLPDEDARRGRGTDPTVPAPQAPRAGRNEDDRRGGRGETAASHPPREGRPQRPLPLRERQEIQEMPRRVGSAATVHVPIHQTSCTLGLNVNKPASQARGEPDVRSFPFSFQAHRRSDFAVACYLLSSWGVSRPTATLVFSQASEVENMAHEVHEVERNKEDQNEIEGVARGYEKELTVERSKANRFDLGEVCLEAALVIVSMTLLTKRKTFWGIGMAVAVLGLGIALTGLWVG